MTKLTRSELGAALAALEMVSKEKWSEAERAASDRAYMKLLDLKMHAPEEKPMAPIKFHYSTIDRFSESRTFKTLDGARKYATKRLGDTFDVGSWYAVDMFGTGKLRIVSGTTWGELFPGKGL